MLKGKQTRILNMCADVIDLRMRTDPKGPIVEPHAFHYACAFLEGAINSSVFIGKQDLAESFGRMLDALQRCQSWTIFRQTIKRT